MAAKLASHSTGLNVKNHDGPIHLSGAISADVCGDILETHPAGSKKVSSTIESETRCMSRP